MATFVKGNAVPNASGYELLEKVGESYNSLATASEINFEVSAMPFEAGDHLLAVKAKGDGVNYSDSDPSETVTYTVADDSYVSYLGAEDFSFVGARVQTDTASALGWKEATTGTTSAATDYIEVDSGKEVWLSYVACVNDQLASGGFYDANKTLVAPLYWETFGQEVDSSLKFFVPEKPVSIADIEAEWNCTIKYVRFIAWSASAGGLENTEGRIITPA